MRVDKNLVPKIEAWARMDPAAAPELLRLAGHILRGDQAATATAADMFGSRLAFGTAGLRGPLRHGPNGMNRVVVCQTTAGLARYLLDRKALQSQSRLLVAVGFDGRHQSDVFAQDVAQVLSAQGIRAAVLPRPFPTPVLAYAVRNLNADAGVMITASHNPATDNGYKVYLGGEDGGSQIISPTDREIEARVLEFFGKSGIAEIPRSIDLIENISGQIVMEYLSAVSNSLSFDTDVRQPIRSVYTPIHGVGGETFFSAIRKFGLEEPDIVEEQFEPNPDFPTAPFPNPEEEEASKLSFEKARAIGADIILAHDPDADRLAVALPRNGTFAALTGNQIGAILGWHCASRAVDKGETGTLANSIVSSPVLRKIALHFGLQHEETLTGFKFVSRVPNLIFGFEEALGYLVSPDIVRDKDGISAGLVILDLASRLASENASLWHYLEAIEASVGSFASRQITIPVKRQEHEVSITDRLRMTPLKVVGSLGIVSSDDFLEGVDGFPVVDVLRYYLEDGSRLIVRPSGTEAKTKVYLDTAAPTRIAADEAASSLEEAVVAIIDAI